MDLVDAKEAAVICGLKLRSIRWAIQNKKIPVYSSTRGKYFLLRSDVEKWRDTKKKVWCGRQFAHFPPPYTEGDWHALCRKVQIGWNRRDGLDYDSIVREAEGQGSLPDPAAGQLGEVSDES